MNGVGVVNTCGVKISSHFEHSPRTLSISPDISPPPSIAEPSSSESPPPVLPLPPPPPPPTSKAEPAPKIPPSPSRPNAHAVLHSSCVRMTSNHMVVEVVARRGCQNHKERERVGVGLELELKLELELELMWVGVVRRQ